MQSNSCCLYLPHLPKSLTFIAMIAIEYPSYQPKVKEQANARLIFDPVRKQWVALTPEEWVRQHFLQYLLQVKNYPAPLIAVEKEINLWGLKKRCDIVVFNTGGAEPKLLVECKQPSVALDQQVIDQALRYNMNLQVSHIVITNGSHTAAFHCAPSGFIALDAIPDWATLTTTI
jgi:Type I restriction enzyme R protein N terminus (HSDR_N)